MPKSLSTAGIDILRYLSLSATTLRYSDLLAISNTRSICLMRRKPEREDLWRMSPYGQIVLKLRPISQLTAPHISDGLDPYVALHRVNAENPKNTFALLAGRLLMDVNTWLILENSEDRTRPYTILGMECNLLHPIFCFCFCRRRPMILRFCNKIN